MFLYFFSTLSEKSPIVLKLLDLGKLTIKISKKGSVRFKKLVCDLLHKMCMVFTDPENKIVFCHFFQMLHVSKEILREQGMSSRLKLAPKLK